jgi:hypothetical protein
LVDKAAKLLVFHHDHCRNSAVGHSFLKCSSANRKYCCQSAAVTS